ncbi:hypothetical protein J4419_04125 [Candidatus Woesearchaeota archaeon]|nr:hypothetical protein [Candidatus Woesearchaeota archaeon]
MDASAFRRLDRGYVVRAYEGHLEPELRLPYVLLSPHPEQDHTIVRSGTLDVAVTQLWAPGYVGLHLDGSLLGLLPAEIHLLLAQVEIPHTKMSNRYRQETRFEPVERAVEAHLELLKDDERTGLIVGPHDRMGETLLNYALYVFHRSGDPRMSTFARRLSRALRSPSPN